MFVVMPIAPAYEEYAMEIMNKIAMRNHITCYDNDYAMPIHRRALHFYHCRIVIVGKANMETETIILRSPWLDTIETYTLAEFLNRLDEFGLIK